MPLNKEFIKSNNSSDTYIETGYDKGNGVQNALDCDFKSIISIEKYNINDRFEGNPKVTIYHGDSAKLLPKVISNKPCFIFLDAHGEQETPIIFELTFLLTRIGDKIIVDDRRYFETGKAFGQDTKPFYDLLKQFKSVKKYRTTRKLNDVFILEN